jgi:tetratricopeptide (TPR) repeat protein
VALISIASGAAWWYFRPRAPERQPPAVDLSRAEPEVAGAIRGASDRVRAAPRDAAAWGKLGMLLLAHDFEAESRSAFAAAAELDPADYRWPYLEGLTLVLREPEAGLARLRRAAELAPVNRSEPRLRLAELLVERGDLDRAAELARAALAKQPAGARAELVLARVAAARADWPGVLDWAGRCELNPACRRESALLRARALEATGRREEADAAFRAAAELPEPPGWPDPVIAEVESLRVGTRALLARAAALIAEGGATEAAGLLEEAAARAPNDPRPGLLLGQALIQARNAPAARKVLEGYTGRFPSSVEGWFNLGVARFEAGDFAAAADAFRRTTELKPDHALAHFNLGHCRLKLGDKTGAKAEFEAALRCRPDYKSAREALANLAAEKK